MIYQWAHPHLVPFYFLYFFHQIYERSAAQEVKRLPYSQKAVNKSSSFFSSCVGSSSHDHNTLYIVGESLCTSKYSQLIFLDWYPILYCLFLTFFDLKLASLSCLFKWSPECKKKMLHGFSPRSPVPSVVSTHLKLSFRWGESLLFLKITCTKSGSICN